MLLIEPIYVLAVGDQKTCQSLVYRPGAREFIERLAVHFDIVFYSSRESRYLSMVRQEVDPGNLLVKQILDYRHCARTAGGRVIKDMGVLTGCSLREIVMVDYKPQNVARHLANAVCFFYFDPGRSEPTEYLLGECLQHLIALSVEADVRVANSKRLPYYQFLEFKKEEDSKKSQTQPYLF